MELMAFALGAFATILIGTVLVWINDLIERGGRGADDDPDI